MNLGTALDVAIGLVLMYLLLSLAVTAAVEYLSQLFTIRANNLAYTLRRLLDGGSSEAQKGKSILRLFLAPPVASLPGVAPAGLFGKFEASGQIATMTQSSGRISSYLDSATFAKGLSEALDLYERAKAGPNIAANVVAGLPESPIKQVIQDELIRAGADLAQFEQAMAAWFDKAMDRASGIFKRWTQVVSIALGIALAGALNADTFAVGQRLWDDDVLRDQIVKVAVAKVDGQKSLPDTRQDIDDIRKELSIFPIGWGYGTNPRDCWGWLSKICGIVFTGAALAFGAPFWFDTLSKLVNLRSSGVKPEEKEKKA